MSKSGIFYRPRMRNRNNQMTVFELQLYDHWIPIIFDYDRNKFNLEGALRREEDMNQLNNSVAAVTSFYRKKSCL